MAGPGCGGSSDKQANNDYADSVCSAIGSWQSQIKTIASTFTGVPSQATLEAKLTQVETFRVGCIGAIGPEEMRQAVSAVRDALDDLGITQIAAPRSPPLAKAAALF